MVDKPELTPHRTATPSVGADNYSSDPFLQFCVPWLQLPTLNRGLKTLKADGPTSDLAWEDPE